MSGCGQCASMQSQLSEERTRRLILLGQVRALISWVDDQLDPDGRGEKVRPMFRLLTAVVSRLRMAAELGEGG